MDKRRFFYRFFIGKPELVLLFSIILISGLFYSLTILPGLGHNGDTAEFQYIGKVLGIPHPPGYPLYAMLNSLFILIPIKSIAFRVNLMSIVFALGTLIFLYLLLNRLIKNIWISFFSTLLFAFTQTFWSQAVIAEIYTLNSLFCVLVFYLLIKYWQDQKPRSLYLFFLIYALSFGNHLTMITLFPAIVLFLHLINPKILYRGKTILIAGLCVIVGAGQYLYVLVRLMQQSVASVKTSLILSKFFSIVTARQFQNKMFAFSVDELFSERIPLIINRCIGELTVILLIFTLVGLYSLFRWNKKVFWLFFLSLSGELIYTINYDIRDIHLYLLPVFLIAVIFISKGLEKIYSSFQQLKGRKKSLFFLLLSVLVCYFMVSNYGKVDQSKDIDESIRYSAFIENLPENSIILTVYYRPHQYLKYKLSVEYPKKKIFYIKVVKTHSDPMLLYRMQMRKILRMGRRSGVDNEYFLSNIYIPTFKDAKFIRSEGLKITKVKFSSSRNKKIYTFYKIKD
jgi:hypothetical protein